MKDRNLPNNQEMAGRIAFVTGASSGLGAHLAVVLAAHGARVALGARRKDRLGEVRAAIERNGGEAFCVEVDVADEASVIAAYDAIGHHWAPVDSVIANAGVAGEGRALDLTAEAFDEIMAVNVRGVFLTIREAARRMIAAGSAERQHGRIVIMSSMTAVSVVPGLSAYAASKAAVLQMGRTLARDWARQGISVNSICPGYVATDINADWFASDAGRRQIDKWPRRRLMTPSSLDAIALLLCSDASAQTTGAHFLIDDGQSTA